MPRRPPVDEQDALVARGRRASSGLSPALAAVALLAACSSESRDVGAVRLEQVPSLAPAVAAVCSLVVTGLPKEIAPDVKRRVTAPPSVSTAAWGDPPITLRCGTAPGSKRDELYAFDGVTWAMHDSGASRTWTTVSAKVPVQVVIPDAYEGQAEMLGGLAAALEPTLS